MAETIHDLTAGFESRGWTWLLFEGVVVGHARLQDRRHTKGRIMTEDTQVIEFGITDTALAELKERLIGVDAADDYDLAKTALKECQQLRKKLTESHKEKKAKALAFGRGLDTEKNRIMGKIKEVEDPIKETKDAIDKEAERKEVSRIAEIRVRIGEIQSLGDDLFARDIKDMEARLARLSEIDVDQSFDEFFHEAKSEHSSSTTTLKSAIMERKARAAEAEALDRQREKQEAESARLEAFRTEQEDEARKLREKQDAIEKRQREEQQEIARKQKEEQDRIDTERRELEQRQADEAEAEARDRAEAEAAEKAERLKPDTEKLLMLAVAIEDMTMPTVKSDEAQFVIAETRESLAMVANELRRSTKELA
ncbi:MAG: hypothetical protein V3U60_11250 [Gammaproteobacteria bacterium]